MAVNKNFILVHIDKRKQTLKKEKIGNIFIPPAYEYMLYNLQHGAVTEVGSKAKKLFPEIEVGDIALFHHTVESTPLRLAGKDAKGDEYRLAEITDQNMNNQVYGVIKQNGQLIPMRQYVFINPGVAKLQRGARWMSTLIARDPTIDESVWDDESRLQGILDDYKRRIEDLDKTMYHEPDDRKRTEINQEMGRLEYEGNELSRYIAKPKMAVGQVLFVNPEVTRDTNMQSGSNVLLEKELLIPFDIDGKLFYITYVDYLHGLMN